MKRFTSKIVLLFSMLLVLVSCTQEKAKVLSDQPLGSLFIIGGGPRPDILAERMVEETGLKSGGYIVILPMASEEPDSAIIWSGEQFAKQGITAIYGFNFKSGETLSTERIDSLSKAALIFISGGDQSRFMDIVRDTPIHQAIKDAYHNGAMIAGTSAGAAMMSQKMITGDQKRHLEYTPTYQVIENENIDLVDGLGLINTAIIDQHFVWRSRYNRLITAVLEFPELPGIGIDESTAILVKGNTAEVVGVSQVIVFRNPSKSRKDQNEKLGGYGLTLDVFLPTDKFEIVK
jgi:cyanophycinase